MMTSKKVPGSERQDVADLRHIRRVLGSSKIDMSSHVGVPCSTPLPYERADAQHFPEPVMDASWKLESNSDAAFLRAAYGGRSMREIVIEWAERVGIDDHVEAELAHALAVDRATVSRWLAGHVVASTSASELAGYERRLEQEERRRQQSLKRRASD